MAIMKRQQYEAAFKAKSALEAVKGEKTVAQIASEFGVHPNQVRKWKDQLLSMLHELFSDRGKKREEARDELEAELFRQIGQLRGENEWLKRILVATVELKKQLVERDNKTIAVARQCELLGLSRSSYYYGSSRDDEYNLELMRLLDEQYTKVPFYGVRRLTAWLRARGYIVNPKRVRVLMRRIGLQAINPYKMMSFPFPGFNKKGFFPNNVERLHQGLEYRALCRVYFGHTASKKFAELGNLNG